MEALFLAILVVAHVLVSPAIVLVRQRRMAARLTELSEALRAALTEIDRLRRASGYPPPDASAAHVPLADAPVPAPLVALVAMTALAVVAGFTVPVIGDIPSGLPEWFCPHSRSKPGPPCCCSASRSACSAASTAC